MGCHFRQRVARATCRRPEGIDCRYAGAGSGLLGYYIHVHCSPNNERPEGEDGKENGRRGLAAAESVYGHSHVDAQDDLIQGHVKNREYAILRDAS